MFDTVVSGGLLFVDLKRGGFLTLSIRGLQNTAKSVSMNAGHSPSRTETALSLYLMCPGHQRLQVHSAVSL